MNEGTSKNNPAGGMAALQVAQSHLSTLLSATDALDSKGSLIVAVGVALFGVYFGALISGTSPTPWVAVAPPAILFLLTLSVGGLTLRPRDMGQFVSPADLLTHMTGEYGNDALAWSYVESIREACVGVTRVLEEKVIGLAALSVLTVCQIVSSAVSAAVWIP